MADRFFSSAALRVGEFVLEGAEAHHLASVRRFEPGDRVVLFDGSGVEAEAEILSTSKKSAVVMVLTVREVDRELVAPVVVASAVPKGDRADFLIEKLVELGTTRWIPLITTRSVVVPKEGKEDKWQRAVIEASKQCGRNRLMQIDPPTPWARCVRENFDCPSRWILHTEGVERETVVATGPGGVIVAIGPEGGWAEDEVTAARQSGWKTFSLGARILRVETAALAAVMKFGQDRQHG
jgi:16S rRNA (uracil1498-N3)-methyltransferase